MPWKVEVLNGTVSDEISAWPVAVRAALLKLIERIEAVGLERVHEPHIKHLRGKIWEMRPSAGGDEGRALYATATGARVVIVLAFMKKQQKTPSRLLDLAEVRAKEIK